MERESERENTPPKTDDMTGVQAGTSVERGEYPAGKMCLRCGKALSDPGYICVHCAIINARL